MIPDLLLIFILGFLGSFGHCAGMCGPLTVAFSLSHQQPQPSWKQQLYFHGLLNLGRLLSYGIIGGTIGGLSSVLIAGGQLAGIESDLRYAVSILTGILLIWMGLAQIKPGMFASPLVHPFLQGTLHQWFNRRMVQASLYTRWWTPWLLGLMWGLIPCGFLYTAQIRAAGTGSVGWGSAMMLVFGLGTLPMMLVFGVSSAFLSADRRSQLFRLGGWVTLVIGISLLLRTGQTVDYTGHIALLCLMLALIARPLSRVFPYLLRYRRILGVAAFILSLVHMGHTLNHTFEWNLKTLPFMVPLHQLGVWTGILALACLIPPALTSFDRLVKALGPSWRLIHLLSVPALVLGVIHSIFLGSHYLGALEWTLPGNVRTVLLGMATLAVLLIRHRWVWSLLSLEKFYAAPLQSK